MSVYSFFDTSFGAMRARLRKAAWWMVGVLLQLAAGTAARLGQFTDAPGELKAPRRSHNRTVNLD
jgi:hypothetical protein